MELWVPQESFASGEIAPSRRGRASSDEVLSGCQTLTNALLSESGSARKRFGTGDIASTTSGFFARLFLYVHGGRRFVVQFVSQDDDPGDLNTANRQFRVIDAETRAFINFGDNAAHGPFDAFGSAAAYHHHFTATQLEEVYAFQDGTRIVFCHKDRPPLFLERAIGASGAEQWKYGIVGTKASPLVEDFRIPITITRTSGTQIDASADIFTKNDEGSYWRIGGQESSNPATYVYGSWWRADTFVSPRRMTGIEVFGVSGPDTADWTGPFVQQGTLSSITISAMSDTALDSRTFTAGAPTWTKNHIGIPFIFTQGGTAVLFIITAWTSTTVVTGVRIFGLAGTVTGTGTVNLMSVGYDTRFPLLLGRPYLKKHPIYCTALTGTATIHSVEPLALAALGDEHQWLPVGHSTTFDKFNSVAVGGSVFLNGGEVVIQTATSNGAGGGGYTYGVQVKRALRHIGPTIHWGLGWSHGVGFPRCGVAHQARHFFGGFETSPRSIVGSQSGVSDGFLESGLASDRLLFDLTDPTGGTPVWMESAEDLRIGTTTSEGVLAGAPLTAANVAWQRQTGYGGNNVRPVLVGDSVLFASANGLREQSFVFDRDTYIAPDLTDIARHLFPDAHIVQVEYASHPHQVVYVLLADGSMRALSYWKESGVQGWSRFTQPIYPVNSGVASEESIVESICAVRYGGTIGDDELWIVRSFKSGGQGGAGSTVRRIERMTPEFFMDQTVVDASESAHEVETGIFVQLTQAAHKPRLLINGEDIGTFATSVGGVATYRAEAVVESYDFANASTGEPMGFIAAVAQSFTGNGGVLTRATFHAQRSNSPTGSIACKLYAHSGTFGTSSVPTGAALATATNTYDAATLPTSDTVIEFTFDGTFTLVNGTKYCIALDGVVGDITNNVLVASDNTSPTAPGNAAYGTWSAQPTRDLIFSVSAVQGSVPASALAGRSIPFTMVPVVQAPTDRTGGLTGRIQAVASLLLLLNESRGGSVGVRQIDTSLTETTGWVLIAGPGASQVRPPQVSIQHDRAYHFEVCSLNMKVMYGG